MLRLSNSAQVARNGATTGKTKKQRDLTWDRWVEFHNKLSIKNDIFLVGFSQRKRTIIMSSFAQAIRERCFSIPGHDPLYMGTVKTTVDNVSQVFRDHGYPDPRLDEDKVVARILQQQYHGYKEKDPGERQEKAIPLSMLRHAIEISTTPLETACAVLAGGALFFCMRSCEYVKVPDQHDKKTKLLCLRNIRFFVDDKETKYNDKWFSKANTVSITFEDQKNGNKMETISLHETGDKLICPVKFWSLTILRIRSYNNVNDDTPVSVFQVNGQLKHITNTHIIDMLRSTADKMGKDKLGFKSLDIGTHSIRSGGAMTYQLSGDSPHWIMLKGRWRSLSFMKYIRTQIREFSKGMTSHVLKHEHFTHVPELNTQA